MTNKTFLGMVKIANSSIKNYKTEVGLVFAVPFAVLQSNENTKQNKLQAASETFMLKDHNVFFNFSFDKGRLKNFVVWFLKTYGESKTIGLLEKLKEVGFGYATKAGISLGIDDLRIPPQKTKLLVKADKKTGEGNLRYTKGEITDVERLQNFISVWHETSENLKKEVVNHFEATDILNPVYMMAFSGARGNLSQVRQLVGMRGLMSDPQGQIIDFPIRSNFREGLSLTEYVISTYGARKGIVDTALRTANAGYLTRRLVDVAQHVIISEFDCKTNRGIFVFDMKEGTKTIYPLQQRLIGRVLAEDVFSGKTKIASRNQEISKDCAEIVTKISKKVLIRSPLSCATKTFVCQLCYGWSLATNRLVPIGEAVGVIAGQSIGEPGTQLTMRTFHTGGVFSGGISDQINAQYDCIVEYPSAIAGTCVKTPQGEIAFLTKSTGSMILRPVLEETMTTNNTHSKNKNVKVIKVPPYSLLFARNGQRMYNEQLVALLSSSGFHQRQTTLSEQVLYSDREGEIYTTKMQIVEVTMNQVVRMKRNNENVPKQIIFETRDWGEMWILSGKNYEIPLDSLFFPNPGDLISPSSILNRIGWVAPENCVSFLKQTTDNSFTAFQGSPFGLSWNDRQKNKIQIQKNAGLTYKFYKSKSRFSNLTNQTKNRLYNFQLFFSSSKRNHGLYSKISRFFDRYYEAPVFLTPMPRFTKQICFLKTHKFNKSKRQTTIKNKKFKIRPVFLKNKQKFSVPVFLYPYKQTALFEYRFQKRSKWSFTNFFQNQNRLLNFLKSDEKHSLPTMYSTHFVRQYNFGLAPFCSFDRKNSKKNNKVKKANGKELFSSLFDLGRKQSKAKFDDTLKSTDQKQLQKPAVVFKETMTVNKLVRNLRKNKTQLFASFALRFAKQKSNKQTAAQVRKFRRIIIRDNLFLIKQNKRFACKKNIKFKFLKNFSQFYRTETQNTTLKNCLSKFQIMKPNKPFLISVQNRKKASFVFAKQKYKNGITDYSNTDKDKQPNINKKIKISNSNFYSLIEKQRLLTNRREIFQKQLFVKKRQNLSLNKTIFSLPLNNVRFQKYGYSFTLKAAISTVQKCNFSLKSEEMVSLFGLKSTDVGDSTTVKQKNKKNLLALNTYNWKPTTELMLHWVPNNSVCLNGGVFFCPRVFTEQIGLSKALSKNVSKIYEKYKILHHYQDFLTSGLKSFVFNNIQNMYDFSILMFLVKKQTLNSNSTYGKGFPVRFCSFAVLPFWFWLSRAKNKPSFLFRLKKPSNMSLKQFTTQPKKYSKQKFLLCKYSLTNDKNVKMLVNQKTLSFQKKISKSFKHAFIFARFDYAKQFEKVEQKGNLKIKHVLFFEKLKHKYDSFYFLKKTSSLTCNVLKNQKTNSNVFAKLQKATQVHFEKHLVKNKENTLTFVKPLYTDQRKFAKMVFRDANFVETRLSSKLSVSLNEVWWIPQQTYKIFQWGTNYKVNKTAGYVSVNQGDSLFALINRQGKKQFYHSKLNGIAKVSFSSTRKSQTQHLPDRYMFHSPFAEQIEVSGLQPFSLRKHAFRSNKDLPNLFKNPFLKYSSLQIVSNYLDKKWSDSTSVLGNDKLDHLITEQKLKTAKQIARFCENEDICSAKSIFVTRSTKKISEKSNLKTNNKVEKVNFALKKSILKAIKLKLKNNFYSKYLNQRERLFSKTENFVWFSKAEQKGSACFEKAFFNQTSFLGHFLFKKRRIRMSVHDKLKRDQLKLRASFESFPHLLDFQHENKFINIQIQHGWIYFSNNPVDFSLLHQSIFNPGKFVLDDVSFEKTYVYTKCIFLKKNHPIFAEQNLFPILHCSATNKKQMDKEEFIQLQKDKHCKIPFTKIDKILKNEKCRFKPPTFAPLRLPYSNINKNDIALQSNVKMEFENSPVGSFVEQQVKTQKLNDRLLYDSKLENNEETLVVMILPMQHKILPNLSSYKRQIYRGQKNSGIVNSSLMKEKFYLSDLNKQKCDRKFTSSYPGADFKVFPNFKLPILKRKETNKFLKNSGVWNFKKSKKLKAVKKEQTPFLSIYSKQNLKDFNQQKLKYASFAMQKSENKFTLRNLSLSGHFSQNFYFSCFPLYFNSLLLKASLSKDFSNTFNKVNIDIYPPAVNLNSGKNLFLYFNKKQKNLLSNLIKKSTVNSQLSYKVSNIGGSVFNNQHHSFLDNREKLSTYTQESLFSLSFHDKQQLLSILTSDSFNKILTVSLSAKFAFFANQRLAANFWTNLFLKNSTKPNFLSVSQLFSAFPFFRNTVLCNSTTLILKNRVFGFTSFFSPFTGEVIPLQTNSWLKKNSSAQALVLTKRNLFSVNLGFDESETDTFKFFDSDLENKQKNFKKVLLNKHQFFLQAEKMLKVINESSIFKQNEIVFEHEHKLYKVKNVPIGFARNFKPLRLGSFVKYGSPISPDYGMPRAGQIIHIGSKKTTLRHGQMLIAPSKSILHVESGDFIYPNMPVLTLPFQTLKTGDIVQGIPKVEQYFEARETKAGRLFYGSLPNLLHNLFRRYCLFLPRDLAVRKSILKIQQILVDGVQRVYRSQGVDIIDKHLEVIVRQMTCRVQIIHPGETAFFPGELMDLTFLETINPYLLKPVKYAPVVLGITRASLEVDSFLSAASFQHTVKILSKAALYRKKDFLKGLKENLITANLIRAGTGYFLYKKI